MVILKKWTVSVFVLVMIALLSSCEGDKYYEEEYVDSYTQDYTVQKGDWSVGKDDSGEYFYYEFRESNLTQYIYENGIMQAFLFMDEENITPLPFNDYWIDESNPDYMWTEQVTCEFRPGFVTFILKYSDHATNEPPHYNYTFRVRFMW
ncbi:MAG: hypothetical protein FWF53_10680 [Candidatus Azobacteroides sp.]|nr:hypothetical protein [Candidatus Azobacteroides sp.]